MNYIFAIIGYFTFFPLLLASEENIEIKKLIYITACNTGVGTAVENFPTVPLKDEMLTRGYRSCLGSYMRILKSGELENEKNLIEFACGYAVGAMTAKYGLHDEMKPMSLRMIKTITTCVNRSKKQMQAQ